VCAWHSLKSAPTAVVAISATLLTLLLFPAVDSLAHRRDGVIATASRRARPR
jgi:hypothetical protein